MVHRWFIAGSLWFITYYVWFIAGSLLVHRWFIEFLSFFIEVVSFSYLKPGHILSSYSMASKQNLHQKDLLSKRFLSPGSSLVHRWFIAGSSLVHHGSLLVHHWFIKFLWHCKEEVFSRSISHFHLHLSS